MVKHTLRAYQRVLKFDHATDVEEGKIRREMGTYLKETRNADQLAEQLFKDPQDEDLIEAFQSTEHRASKEHRNAKRHKRRLSELQQEGLS